MTAGTAEAGTTGAGASATDLEAGRRVLALEAEALAQLGRMLDASFTRALDLLAATTGRVVVSGMGKSGLVGRKIAATLASTGTPAQYVHPGEASHGDLGMIARGDAVLALSNSGETPELADLLAHSRRFAIPLVAITSRAGSTLAQTAVWARVEPAREVMATSGIAKRREWASRSASSGVSPEFESASTASPRAIMPRSPWLASPGWTYWAGVPVEASVAAILRPTSPDLPMPETTTRPVVAASRSSARVKLASSMRPSCASASASSASTRRPASRSVADAPAPVVPASAVPAVIATAPGTGRAARARGMRVARSCRQTGPGVA